MFESFFKITIKVSRREPFLFNKSGKILLEKDQKRVFMCPCAGFMCLTQFWKGRPKVIGSAV